MDPNYADKTWKVLEDAIREIHNQNASGLSFEELYRNAYNMVLHKYGDRLYNGVAQALTRQLQTIAGRVEAAQGESFLKELKARWDDHIKSTQMIRDILMYMDRTYVTQQHKTPVFQLGLDLWRDHVVHNATIQQRMLATLNDLISRERAGEVIERSLLRATTQMLVDLGPAVYEADFERPFLAGAADFYAKEAQAFVASCDCPQYLRKAERRLGEEVDRVKHYLDASTEAKITRVVENELIREQMRALVDMEGSGLVAMLEGDKYEDLGRMYGLLKRVEGGPGLMRQVMCDHVKESGRQLVMDPERQKDPIGWVSRLLEERDKFEALVARGLADDKTFRNALNQAFEHFINLNPRSPEYISLFIDDRLRKGLKGASDADVEAVLDKTMALFRYLQEKDVFEKYYKQHLAKRLLGGRTVSDDAERGMLVKLKTECGYQFTSKLESMFTDIKTSRDTLDDFRQRLTEKSADLGLDLTVQVLTTGSWPTQSNAKEYYLAAHSGRRLTWQLNMGNVDLRAQFGSRKHELTVSTYNAVILLLFNSADSPPTFHS
ncbi:cullin 3 [Monoraphidium neglectum]|uniref:Cullin 3 n=1 Tax=Monoraphidium neglectum TaxID=145388 RepID=A0A0D2JNG0_9CHLO|nr:cullin 3 [Monoraphidium neglectum]KIZ00668.1 cullin 3 [Monoraphidium neglectum]|eukprot:XP_013899687.1 cullin 3 [Monoraphidium neglectum]